MVRTHNLFFALEETLPLTSRAESTLYFSLEKDPVFVFQGFWLHKHLQEQSPE